MRNQSLQTFLALRYLRGAEGHSEGRRFLRLVIRIAVGGVAVGVATLILSLAIVRGFSQEITRKIVGFGAQIQIESLRDAPLSDAESYASIAAAQPGVVSTEHVVLEFVLLRTGDKRVEGAAIWGTEQLPAYVALTMGTQDATLSPDDVYIGASLARTLRVEPGDRITLFSIPPDGMRGRPRVGQFTVAGMYESSLADFDDLYLFTELNRARQLVGYEADEATRIDVRVEEGQDYERIAAELDEELPFPAMARPISEVYRSLFAWVRLQQSIIPLVLSIIVLVAAVNVIGTLLMVILEKRSDIGVLMGMGARGRDMTATFTRVGLGIGIAGSVLGAAIALVFALLQIEYGIIPLPPEAYYMKEAPIALSLLDFALVPLLTCALCTGAAFVPARYASKIDPIRAIHLQH